MKKEVTYSGRISPAAWLIFFCVGLLPIFAQLNTVVNTNATALAQAILGNGITVSNARLNSGQFSSGTFAYSGNYLGISKGIVLSTGEIGDIANAGSYFCSVITGNSFSDPDVLSISSKARYDLCILEFDFVPACDTLRIEYVFGSDEYPQAVYHVYNDVFAMFLSGPDPAGGKYVSRNIATLPNGITPVSIDSINGGWPTSSNASHPEFYYDNYTSPNNQIAYNGYTKPVTSKAALVPCGSYHLKVAIADGGNGRYDSGVFIKENSLACRNTASAITSTQVSCDNSGTVSVHISNYAGSPFYTWLPGGENSPVIRAAPGNYTCLVNLPGTCSDLTLTATVPQVPTVAINTPDQFICSGHTLQINAQGAGTYTWYPLSGLSAYHIPNPVVAPTITTTYTLSGTALNGCVSSAVITLSTSADNLVADYVASTYTATVDNSTIYFEDHTPGSVSWDWRFDEVHGSTLRDPVQAFPFPGNYQVSLTVSDINNCRASVSKTIEIKDILNDLYTFYVPDTFTPNGDNVNDSFFPVGMGWDKSYFAFEIFDRWGASVFRTGDLFNAWDGKVLGGDAKEDVYTWKVDVKDVYRNYHHYTGSVLLLR